MTRPEVSVVIPTRNRAGLLALTLRSVLAQRAVDFEVLVVDDGDDGASLPLPPPDPRVRLIRNAPPHGTCRARNRGIAEARGEWVAFCDDDDLWAPGKLSAQMSAARSAGAAWVYAGDVSVDLDLRVLSGAPPLQPEDMVRDLPRYNTVPAGASNVVVYTATLRRAGPFDPALRTGEDWDMWLRLASGAGRPACVAEPLVALRRHRGMASRDVGRMFEDFKLIARRHGNPVDMARHHRWAAWMALEDGDRRRALRHYACAVRTGDWSSAGRALVGFVDPQIASRRRLSETDPWAVAARQWLDELRRPARPAGEER